MKACSLPGCMTALFASRGLVKRTDPLGRLRKPDHPSKRKLSHETQQMVCRHLHTSSSSSGFEHRKTQRARCRSRLWYLSSRSHGYTAMHKQLSCALSRLYSCGPVAIVAVSGCLPRLHPIHLQWFRTRMTDVPFEPDQPSTMLARIGESRRVCDRLHRHRNGVTTNAITAKY